MSLEAKLEAMEGVTGIYQYWIHSDITKCTYIVFIDIVHREFMYGLKIDDVGCNLLVYKLSIDDLLYEIKMEAFDISATFTSTIEQIVDLLLEARLSDM